MVSPSSFLLSARIRSVQELAYGVLDLGAFLSSFRGQHGTSVCQAKNVTEPHGAYQADFGYGLTGVVDPVFGCLDADEEPLNISIM